MNFVSFLMVGMGMCRILGLVIGCSCMVPLTLVSMVVSGVTIHPQCLRVSIRESYLPCFVVIAISGHLQWQYVKSMKCTVMVGERAIGVWLLVGAPRTYRMSCLSRAIHWHGLELHEQGRSQFGIVVSRVWLLWVPTFTNVRYLVDLVACRVWTM